jgi:4-amino-4-deoxy-L-arabinose transferase-like glycosyltransferase
VALSFQAFGVSETAARLPNALFGIAATVLLYHVGKTLFSARVGLLAALVLNVQFIWMQYCRLSAPDIPLVTLILLGIWSLLQAEQSHQPGRWRFGAGLSLGLGFIIRSYVSFLPIVALLPYLVLNHRRHQHLRDWRLYMGYAMGLIPAIAWLWLEWTQFHITSLPALFGFAADLSGSNRHGGGWYYYLWNLTLNAFPWSLFAVLGGVLVWQQRDFPYKSLCLGYPLVLLLEITLVGTRTPRYSLAMYPFMALGAGVALHWLGRVYADPRRSGQGLLRGISYGFGGLGAALILLSFLRSPLIQAIPDLKPYLQPQISLGVFLLGLSWLGIALIYRFQRDWAGAQSWLASLLMGPWLLFTLVSSAGLLGDYNADVKAAVVRDDIATILATHEVDIVWPPREFDNKRLYRFYTPHFGQPYEQLQQVPSDRYVWIKVEPENAAIVNRCEAIPAARGWQLVHVVNHCNQP